MKYMCWVQFANLHRTVACGGQLLKNDADGAVGTIRRTTGLLSSGQPGSAQGPTIAVHASLPP